MADVIVTCINKPERNSPHEHITHLGNPNTPQGGWRWTREEVIASIEAGTNTFFTRDNATGKRADIRVVREAGGRVYLRTFADGIPTDNLLSLNECPLR
jgi:hypothetical protein